MQQYFDVLQRHAANFVPLSPISFLKRESKVHGPRVAQRYGDITRIWAQIAIRCRAIAAGLQAHGIGLGGYGHDFGGQHAGVSTTKADVIAFCRRHLARFKTPKSAVFCDFPKTATGKIRKFLLRDQARQIGPQE